MKLIVYGEAIPQGSKSARIVKGRPILTDGFGKKPRQLKEWRQAIAAEARCWLQETQAAPISGPVILRVTFYVQKPKSAAKRVLYPATRPDLDKMVRAVADALNKLAYEEDSRIVDIVASKRFTIDSAPRAEIEVGPAA